MPVGTSIIITPIDQLNEEKIENKKLLHAPKQFDFRDSSAQLLTR